MKIFLFAVILIILSCTNKPKSVLICGDHICVNKNEAKQYFEENLTLEVRILDKKNSEETDLIELNLKEKNNKKKVSLKKKETTSKKIKTLSPKEIKDIKKRVEIKKSKNKEISKEKYIKEAKSKSNINKFDKKAKVNEDICTFLKECSIDEISKYLINEGKNKRFPDITIRN